MNRDIFPQKLDILFWNRKFNFQIILKKVYLLTLKLLIASKMVTTWLNSSVKNVWLSNNFQIRGVVLMLRKTISWSAIQSSSLKSTSTEFKSTLFGSKLNLKILQSLKTEVKQTSSRKTLYIFPRRSWSRKLCIRIQRLRSESDRLSLECF